MLKKWGNGLLLFLVSLSVHAVPTQWEGVDSPTRNQTSSIGSYANGCLDGAQALPLQGLGYQVIRPQRKRYYGHTDAIRFVEALGKSVNDNLNQVLMIGDISLPRGGRFSSGHSSHQTGLDIDIWLRLNDRNLSLNQLAVPTPISVVDLTNYKLRKENWQDNHFKVLRYAAKDPNVARIFVHPVIKQTLCDSETAQGDERNWLGKIRPWWGHHSHFHVRLHCPKDATSCVEQKAPPKGDGCGYELASWTPKQIPVPPPTKVAKSKPKKKKVMPEYCSSVIAN